MCISSHQVHAVQQHGKREAPSALKMLEPVLALSRQSQQVLLHWHVPPFATVCLYLRRMLLAGQHFPGIAARRLHLVTAERSARWQQWQQQQFSLEHWL